MHKIFIYDASNLKECLINTRASVSQRSCLFGIKISPCNMNIVCAKVGSFFEMMFFS